MFQVQHLLVTPERALMPGHTFAPVPDLYVSGVDLGLHLYSNRQWRRVEVCQHLHRPLCVDIRKIYPSQFEAFVGQGQQVLALQIHGFPHALAPSADYTTLIFWILPASAGSVLPGLLPEERAPDG